MLSKRKVYCLGNGSKSPEYGQHPALLYVCGEGVSILYHETESVPLVLSMSPYIYHDPMRIPWVAIYTMSSCIYHESMSIPWIQITKNIFVVVAKIQFSEIQKFILQE